jgi:hypothetical protein
MAGKIDDPSKRLSILSIAKRKMLLVSSRLSIFSIRCLTVSCRKIAAAMDRHALSHPYCLHCSCGYSQPRRESAC